MNHHQSTAQFCIDLGALGKKTKYQETYAPELLHPVPRSLARNKVGFQGKLPFHGVDIWTGFELSWLNLKGKPLISCADIRVPYDSPFLIESKSLKLYLNSFNQTCFEDAASVQQVMQCDLSRVAEGSVEVLLYPAEQLRSQEFSGICLDDLDISIESYSPQPDLLKSTPELVQEKLYSHLLKSNCLATGQPDWGTLYIHYAGPQIDHASLLRYIISYRRHSGFAEHIVEQTFHDLLQSCASLKLTVYARFTRRGGLDINPFRSNFEETPINYKLLRQ